MRFNQRLAAAASAVEDRLGSALDEQQDAIPARLLAAMRHAVLGGGKRFRPFLVIESARLFGLEAQRSVTTAAALECIHCYSLVHDDLPAMDNDELRRGQPTVWRAFDEYTAILAGDALLTLAFELLARDALSDAVRARLMVELARAAGAAGMVGGQQLDLDAERRGEPAVADLAHVRRLQALKTGALIRFACKAGAILAEADKRDTAALVRYGEDLGFAFQIADDLLDATGDAAVVGKAVAKDAAAGKATLVSLMGIEAARRKLAEVEASAVAALTGFGERGESLVEAARFVVARRS